MRKTSGITSQEDLTDLKIYLRSFSDALICVKQIAEKDVASQHYKSYIRSLIGAMRSDSLLLDSEGKVVASRDMFALNAFRTMQFSEEVAKRYGLSSEGIKDFADLD